MTSRRAYFVLARTSSNRLPGKAFLSLNKKPMIEIILRKMLDLEGGDVYLLTGESDRDDELVRLAEDVGAHVYRGDEHDVVSRIVGAVAFFQCDSFFRVNGDSPCIEGALLARAAEIMDSTGCDFVSNLVNRTFPYGVSVELVKSKAYLGWAKEMRRREERENPTLYVYDNLGTTNFRSIERQIDSSGVRMTIDTLADYLRMRKLIRKHERFLDYDLERKIDVMERS